jgi:5'-3' exonuclease, N-terminal resolvase-like domain
MSQTYIIIDTQNLFFRIRHGVKAPDAEQQLALALHIIFSSIKKVWNQFDAGHTVFCLEGRSWRKDIYTPYKANRKIAAIKRTQREIEEDEVFFEIMDDFITFIRDTTNCTVLKHPEAEADDMISRWIALHPHDSHIVISSDSDFQQLIAPNVMIYNGISGLLYTHQGIFDKDGNIAKNKHGTDLPVPDPEWILFEKCIRGDDGDNIMSAYPGVRTKKLQESYADRVNKGFSWNNLMLSKWTDHDGVEHRVKDDYERNRLLIDLSMQPADLLEKFDYHIMSSIVSKPRKQVGLALMKFCNRHGLVKIEKSSGEYSSCFSSIYTGKLLEIINEQEPME